MMDSLTHCFNGVYKRCESITEESKPIYRDDLNLTNPTEDTNSLITPEGSLLQNPTKKTKSLQRAKRIDKSLRFEEAEGEEATKPLVQKEGLKPRKVVRFQLEDNTIVKPKKFNEKEKTLEEKEGLSFVKEEVVRVKIKMTKIEAEKLLSKCRNDSVLDLEHVVHQIANVPVHQVKVAVVVVACNDE